MKIFILLLLPLIAFIAEASPTLVARIGNYCGECPARFNSETATFILEYGEDALKSRAWLTQNVEKSIDVQYFIWSTDNIGILAGEALLSAAERGVKVRVIVDDLLIDVEDKTLLSLAAHPNIQIKVYNPKHSVGTSTIKKFTNTVISFRGVNQRMHDKTAIFDNLVGITGGRNMADEYFDFNQYYNFRDRDILVMGKSVTAMTENFEEFWGSELSVPVERLLDKVTKKLTAAKIRDVQNDLHAYAANTKNFEPEIRESLKNYDSNFQELAKDLVWDPAVFISDPPGKNDNDRFLAGGGESTAFLVEKVEAASKEILIQSPYLIFPHGALELFQDLIRKGVRVRISTNSLASTDNLMAFSGYQKQRHKIIAAGIQVFEYKPYPKVQQELIKRYPRLAEKKPVFAIHAKSLVIDNDKIFIGTFNLDPRSANLNTEVGVFVESSKLARQLTESVERDISPGNSWETTSEFNPDSEAGRLKRIKSWLFSLLPITDLL